MEDCLEMMLLDVESSHRNKIGYATWATSNRFFLYSEHSTSDQILQNKSFSLQFAPECLHWGRRCRERESPQHFPSQLFTVIQLIFSCYTLQGVETDFSVLTWQTSRQETCEMCTSSIAGEGPWHSFFPSTSMSFMTYPATQVTSTICISRLKSA